MFVASWQGFDIASGLDVIEVEGRFYFRPEDVRQERLKAAQDRSICEWKGGEAEYFDVNVDGMVNRAAAWRYMELGDNVRSLVGRFAFWKDVSVGWVGYGDPPPHPRIEAMTPNVAKALGATDIEWLPDVPALAGLTAEAATFAGYLIPSRRVLVDVLATPAAAERSARIEEARSRGEAIHNWNREHADDHFGYIAVWGSAPPSAEALEALIRGGVLLDLTSPPTLIDSTLA